MLGLKLPTDPRWTNLAEIQLSDVLTDHAYCEQKAASACISLIQQFPDRKEMVDKLAPIVTEEWGHFRMVIREMDKRQIPLGKQRKDEYVNALQSFVVKGGSRDAQLLDRLLLSGLIEARSCERFRLLSEGLQEPALRDFYRQFMVSEAGHYRLFLDLARLYFPAEQVKVRWQQWLDYEAEVIKNMTIRGDRMH